MDLLEMLKLRKRLKQPIWFRGQENAAWGLEPTITRATGGLSAEGPLTTRFKQNAQALISERPSSEWEWLFIMLHYGVPTRLLDWSESPLIGLYFAVAGSEKKAPGTLWHILPIELNRKANIRMAHPSAIPGFGDDDILDNYLPSSLAKEHTSHLTPAAAIAPRNTKRMQAQHGVFTITHRDQTSLDEIGDGSHIWRIIIPARSKARILKELETFNIRKLTLFPELDQVASHAKELLG